VVTSVDMSLTIWKLTPSEKAHGMPEPTLITLIHQHSNTLLASSLWARILDCEQSLNVHSITKRFQRAMIIKLVPFAVHGDCRQGPSAQNLRLPFRREQLKGQSLLDPAGQQRAKCGQQLGRRCHSRKQVLYCLKTVNWLK